MRRWNLWGLAALALFVVGCNINVYIVMPTDEEMQDYINDNEADVEKEAKTPAPAENPKEQGWLGGTNLLCIADALIQPACAQDDDTDVSNAAIRSINEARKKRWPDLEKFFGGGTIGEGKDGLVTIKSTEGLDMKMKADLKKLIDAENGDRKELFKEIAKAKDIPADKITDVVVKNFVAVRRKRSKAGWWYVKDDGTWYQKTEDDVKKGN
jgi:uncharacterized protein YdbL (DUF1318 family)